MDLSLNESQKMLKSSARDFLKRECPWTTIKQIDDSPDGFSGELWRKIFEMGWPAMIFPEKCGGMGSCLTDLAMIYEEMGQALVPGVFFSSSILCGSIIAEAGSEEQKVKMLATIAEGKVIYSLAMTEPDYGWGPECIHLSAKSENGKYLLGGTKRFIQDASEAFLECGHLAHEVHAGLGVDKKYPLYLYSKSSKTLYYIHIWGIPTITANESPGYWGFN